MIVEGDTSSGLKWDRVKRFLLPNLFTSSKPLIAVLMCIRKWLRFRGVNRIEYSNVLISGVFDTDESKHLALKNLLY